VNRVNVNVGGLKDGAARAENKRKKTWIISETRKKLKWFPPWIS
jgi:hypothetical protein